MGQFRALVCPICGSPDNGKWTCVSCTTLVGVHRELIRNLQHWRSLYEALEVPDVLVSAANGLEYSLWDAQLFYEQRKVVAPRMQQSIQFYLYENMKESVAAQRMSIRPTNPVGTYATIGLTMMIAKAVRGELASYVIDLEPPREVANA